MAKYLILWEVDPSRAPEDPKERGGAWSLMLDMIKQDMKEGTMTDWGSFVGEGSGYAVAEQQDEVELSKNLQRFFPYVTFMVKPVMTVEQTAEMAKALTE